MLGVLGSINIIGNPVFLVKSLGIGIYDLVDIPMTGFVKGPIEVSYILKYNQNIINNSLY